MKFEDWLDEVFPNGFTRGDHFSQREIAAAKEVWDIFEAKEVNQCDGCCQGLPNLNGVHWRDGLPWIACTKNKYVYTPPGYCQHGVPTQLTNIVCKDCEIERLQARLAEIENWVDRYAGTYDVKITHEHALIEIAKVLDRWRTADSASEGDKHE